MRRRSGDTHSTTASRLGDSALVVSLAACGHAADGIYLLGVGQEDGDVGIARPPMGIAQKHGRRLVQYLDTRALCEELHGAQEENISSPWGSSLYFWFLIQ